MKNSVESMITAGVTILIGIVGVATIALLVSPRADTTGLIGSTAGGFRDVLCAALRPVGGCGGPVAGTVPTVDSSVTFPSGSTTFPTVPTR
jgi:hypothetical protein